MKPSLTATSPPATRLIDGLTTGLKNSADSKWVQQFSTLPPLALYIHLPWCEHKCPYCDFNSHPASSASADGSLPQQGYIDALIADLDSHLPQIWGRTLTTIFIGGGTPSLFSPAVIDRLLSEVRQRLPFNDLNEVTMEANPGALEQSKLPGFRQAGINRLSLGVQSFNDDALKQLGRIHDAAQAQKAIEAAQTAGFNSFNIDLMFGLPGESNTQTIDQAITDLTTALSYDPAHLSLYQLTLEPNTAFAKQPPALPDDDLIADMQTALHQQLADSEYQHYEVSAFSKPNLACKHNANYWQFGDYLGIGAGAHSKISCADKIIRERKIKDPLRYQSAALKGDGRAESRQVDPKELPFEFMLNAMRLQQGVPLSLFGKQTGLPLTTLLPGIERGRELGLIEVDNQQLMPTQQGHQYLNNLIELFLPDA
ncbi:MAG: oxygen-independent coproporphyrinogen III oxidase-like protein [Immundisolibacteraceae bacterium]|nr:oxygen-independent coproporphyrinogen III oxidase-like protein [Immundisolibacteraceae bacterium]